MPTSMSTIDLYQAQFHETSLVHWVNSLHWNLATLTWSVIN